MKNSMLLFVGACGITLVSCGQDGTPSSVESKFKEMFSNAKSVKWDKENEKEWEAEFKMDGKSCSANFSLDGTWLETETEMKVKELPASIKEAITSNFEGYEIESAEQVESPEQNAYEVEIEKGESVMEVVLDANGTILKKKEVQEEDDNDDEDND